MTARSPSGTDGGSLGDARRAGDVPTEPRHPAPARPLPAQPRTIVVSRPGRLGDILLAVPALRALKRSFPAARIDVIAHAWARDLIERLPWVDRFLPFPGFPGMPGPVDRQRTAAFLHQCQAEQFDIVLQAQGWDPPAAMFAALLGGRYVAGYCRPGDAATRLDRCLPTVAGEHEVHRLLRLARAVGATDDGTHLAFPITPADVAEVAQHDELRAALAADAPLVGIHPGAGAPAKQWPPARFAALADALATKHGCRVLLLGGAGDREALACVLAAMTSTPVVPRAPLSLGGFAALMARLDLYVGNDSGPSHLAVAIDTPSIAIFGPGDPARWAPLGTARHAFVVHRVSCSPCDFSVCPIDHRCLEGVMPEQVLRLALRLLAIAAGTRASAADQPAATHLPVASGPDGVPFSRAPVAPLP